jgi:hypothetical protein
MAPVVVRVVVICRPDSIYRGERSSFHDYVYRYWGISKVKGPSKRVKHVRIGPRQHAGLGLVYRLP